jgi:uncharacterized protein (DUF111 family)
MFLYVDCANGISGDMLVAALLDLAGARPGKKGPLERVVRPALKAAGIDPRLVTLRSVTSAGVDALSFRVADAPGFATFDELILDMYASKVDQAVADDVAAVAQYMAAAEREVHGEGEDHLHELSGLDTAVDLIAAAALLHYLGPDRVVMSPPAVGDGVVHTAHGELPVPAPAVAVLLRGVPVHEEPADAERPVGELTTPTGAALLRHFADEVAECPPGRTVAEGRGAGSRTLLNRPNVLRVAVVDPDRDPRSATEAPEGRAPTPETATAIPDEPAPAPEGVTALPDEPTPPPETATASSDAPAPAPVGETAMPDGPAPAPERETEMADDLSEPEAGGRGLDEHVVLETNIDDMSPELFAHAAERLRAAGAVDVWSTPALMKKGRQGMVLHVLAAAADRDRLADVVFAETSTFGLRVLPVGRLYAEQRQVEITIAGKEVGVRLGFVGGRLVTVSPEFDDVCAVAEAVGRPVKVVYEAAQAAARNRFSVS